MKCEYCNNKNATTIHGFIKQKKTLWLCDDCNEKVIFRIDDRKQGALEEFEKLLFFECPVKYYNGTTGDAVPSERIQNIINKLKEKGLGK